MTDLNEFQAKASTTLGAGRIIVVEDAALFSTSVASPAEMDGRIAYNDKSSPTLAANPLIDQLIAAKKQGFSIVPVSHVPHASAEGFSLTSNLKLIEEIRKTPDLFEKPVSFEFLKGQSVFTLISLEGADHGLSAGHIVDAQKPGEIQNLPVTLRTAGIRPAPGPLETLGQKASGPIFKIAEL